MKKVLITGFDPFGLEKINPSFEAVKLLPDSFANAKIIKLCLPTVFQESIDMLEDAINIHQPDIILSIGLATGSSSITLERVAINLDDAIINDNKGNKPINEKIFADGENAYFTNLPIKMIASKLKSSNIPVVISNSAGTFVCNHVYYATLYLINSIPKFKKIKTLFVHVPCILEQVVNKIDIPAIDLNTIVKALEITIETALENNFDLDV